MWREAIRQTNGRRDVKSTVGVNEDFDARADRFANGSHDVDGVLVVLRWIGSGIAREISVTSCEGVQLDGGVSVGDRFGGGETRRVAQDAGVGAQRTAAGSAGSGRRWSPA